ncbi:MAG: 3-deoxy-8-phosphooctulonate synthase [Candidatus Kapabacteria bacterium]|nr:3-deoxy-8-phosphooctulonate synthase [Candidatus Kapabacteria bacterium]
MEKLLIIAGPCVVESYELLETTATKLVELRNKYNFELIFKSSYKKANRTSSQSFEGIGDEIALGYLKKIRDDFHISVLTDIHTPLEAEIASKYVDVLQIPAFLCRQTDLLRAAGKTGLKINIKKGQFLPPDKIKGAIDKIKSTGNNQIMLTERGTFFGYNDLVVDYRSLPIMKKFGYPVIFDATHSLQQPSIGYESGGRKEFLRYLTRAAIAVGIDGIFIETHPEPEKAKSDAATQIKLDELDDYLNEVVLLFDFVSKNINL